jgi:hypothetical protein
MSYEHQIENEPEEGGVGNGEALLGIPRDIKKSLSFFWSPIVSYPGSDRE